MSDNVKLRAIEKKAWKLHCAGKTLAFIAKELGKSDRTISRYLDACRDVLPDEIKSDKSDTVLDRLEAKSWAKLESLIDNPETNDNIIKDICFRVLSARGQLVEQKEHKHTGTIDHEINMKEKLQRDTKEGMNRFGYTLRPIVVSDN